MPLDIQTMGFILILLGIILIVAGTLSGGKADSKVAVVGFIGPVPIGFGNDPRLLQIAVVVGIVIFVLLFLLSRGLI